MSALSLALIMQLSTNPACTVSGMVPEFWTLWAEVARRESSLDPLALHDDTENKPYHPSSIDEAEAIATQLMEKGHSVGVGLSQLTAKNPTKFFDKFKITIHTALDACSNMRVGARWYVTGALSVFNSGSLTKSIDYAQGIMESTGATIIKPDVVNRRPIVINRHASDTEVWDDN